MNPQDILLVAVVATLAAFVGGYLLGCYSCRLRIVKNKQRTFGSSLKRTVMSNPFNNPTRHVFTPSALREASATAKKNPEDF